jgi:hypothetical protein
VAERVLQFTTTIPADTGSDTIYPMAIDGWEIEAIDLEVPAGPAGTMQFYLANNGRPWIPRTDGEYLVWDDHAERFPATDYPSAGGWQVIGSNVGEYDHVVVVRFHVNPLAGAVDLAAVAPAVLVFVERDVPPREVVVL